MLACMTRTSISHRVTSTNRSRLGGEARVRSVLAQTDADFGWGDRRDGSSAARRTCLGPSSRSDARRISHAGAIETPDGRAAAARKSAIRSRQRANGGHSSTTTTNLLPDYWYGWQ